MKLADITTEDLATLVGLLTVEQKEELLLRRKMFLLVI
jgi:hypothetical protein